MRGIDVPGKHIYQAEAAINIRDFPILMLLEDFASKGEILLRASCARTKWPYLRVANWLQFVVSMTQRKPSQTAPRS
jgi:hypothetical protein